MLGSIALQPFMETPTQIASDASGRERHERNANCVPLCHWTGLRKTDSRETTWTRGPIPRKLQGEKAGSAQPAPALEDDHQDLRHQNSPSSSSLSLGVTIPLISIVMPTFNRAAFLPRSLGSALAQTFTDWELIIVDDGGEDRTPEVVSPYLADRRIQYFWHTHRGVGQTRNAGIVRASGRYITFLDSDDAYRPTHLESRLEVLARRPELDLVQGGLEIIGDIYTIDFDDPTKRISLYDCATGATFFGKREVFEALGGFRPLMNYEDTDFWRRAQAQFVTESLKSPQTYEYYRHSESITRTATHEQWQEARLQREASGIERKKLHRAPPPPASP